MQLMHRADEQPQTPNPETPGPPTRGPSTPGPNINSGSIQQNTNSKGGLVTTVNKPMINNGKPGMNTPFSPQPNMQPQQQQMQQQPGMQQGGQGQQIFLQQSGGSAH